MKKGVIALLFLAVVVFQLTFISADGMYVPPYGDYWVHPADQKAIIFYENNQETLIVTSDFQGNAKDLAWIIPTPSRPTITKANEEIFQNIAKLTQPQYPNSPSFGGTMEMMNTRSADSAGVFVFSSQKVDYYNITTLVASNSQDLMQWFEDNGYQYPKEYSYVLDYYIQKQWAFNAIKISADALSSSQVSADLEQGHPTPIKLVFQTDKMVFPLKISSVDFKQSEPPVSYNSQAASSNVYNYDYQYAPVQIYLIADSKYKTSNQNLYPQYANWITKKDVLDLGEDSNGNPLISPQNEKYFVVSLYGSIQKSQMDEDLYFNQDVDNKKVNTGPETRQIILYGFMIFLVSFIIWIFIPVGGLLFLIGALILFLSSNRAARITAWILEIFSLVITALVSLLILALVSLNNTLNYQSISVLIAAGFAILVMVVLMIIEGKYKVKS